MNRRNFLKLAALSPVFPMLGGLVSLTSRPETLPLVKAGEVLTAGQVNAIIQRVNELSR